MKKILVVGSANVDFVVSVKRTPQVGETILCNGFEKVPGGKGANQAYACGRLGAATTFLNVVGDDDLGQALVDNMKRADVRTDAIGRTNQENTGIAIVCVNEEGNNSIIVIPGANSCCDETYLSQNKELFEECDIVLIQMEIPCQSVYYAVDLAHQLGKTVILNPAPAPEFIPDEIYGKLDYLTPNESEFKALTGCPDDSVESIAAYGTRLLEKGVKNIVVTLGERGALLINSQGHTLYQSPTVQAKDTTAAGDTFNAALARKLADGCGCHEAIVFANHASALSVSRKGAQTSIPSYEEVVDFMNHME